MKVTRGLTGDMAFTTHEGHVFRWMGPGSRLEIMIGGTPITIDHRPGWPNTALWTEREAVEAVATVKPFFTDAA